MQKSVYKLEIRVQSKFFHFWNFHKERKETCGASKSPEALEKKFSGQFQLNRLWTVPHIQIECTILWKIFHLSTTTNSMPCLTKFLKEMDFKATKNPTLIGIQIFISIVELLVLIDLCAPSLKQLSFKQLKPTRGILSPLLPGFSKKILKIYVIFCFIHIVYWQ